MKPWMVDAHAHLDDAAFAEDLSSILDAFPREGVLAVVNPGCDRETSRRAVELSRGHAQIFACVGTHPSEAEFYTEALEEQYRAWAQDDKVVGIGEIGLDYHYDTPNRSLQRAVFERQLALAESLDFPVVIHTRDAVQDTYDILRNFGTRIHAVLHCFSESVEMAENFLNLGHYISLGGIVTFRNAKKQPAVARMVPADRLLTETDSPYLAPEPWRGKRNEPARMRAALEWMARARKVEPEELAAQTVKNAGHFYGIEEALKALQTSFAAGGDV
uniref:TatD family hydrolase n=1 Tax=Ndongobacter massiliensis TaxID=1871025 RepID=UPI0009F80BC8|nr:TatD family hydrolase [Ndongobacter massiliensis]